MHIMYCDWPANLKIRPHFPITREVMSNKNSKSNSAATRHNCTTLASNDNIKITSFQHIFSADNIFTEIIVTMNNTVDNRLPRKRKSQNFALLQTIIRNLQ